MQAVANDQVLLDVLERLVKRNEDALAEADEKRRKYQGQLDHARAVLEAEKERLGATGQGRYSRMTLRQAALEVIKEAHGNVITPTALADKLRQEGCLIGSSAPGRVIHAALIGVQEVEKIDGSYRWRNGLAQDQPNEA